MKRHYAWLICVALSSRALLAAPPLPVGPEIRVNVGQNGAQVSPRVAVFQDGGFVVVWSVGPLGYVPGICGIPPSTQTVLHARLFAADGTPTSGEFRLVAASGFQTVDSVATLGNGSFVVVWEQFNSGRRSIVLAARFARDGTRLVPPFRVHAASSLSRFCGQAAVGPDGESFAVAWTAQTFEGPNDHLGHLDAYARRFATSGFALGPELRVAQGFSGGGGGDAVSTAATLAADGSMAVAISFAGDSVDVFVVQLDAQGAVTGVFRPAQDDASQRDATLSKASDGSSVLAWAGSDNCGGGVASAVWAERFAADGTALDSAPLKVNRGGTCEYGAQVVALPGGGFVALWTDGRARDGDHSGVYGRVFGSNGAPQTKDFPVNITTAGNEIVTDIASNARGDIVAVWTQRSGAAAIVARRLSAAAAP